MLAVPFDDQQKDAGGRVRHRKEERKEIFGGFCVHTLSRGNPKIGSCLEKGHSVEKEEREKALNWWINWRDMWVKAERLVRDTTPWESCGGSEGDEVCHWEEGRWLDGRTSACTPGGWLTGGRPRKPDWSAQAPGTNLPESRPASCSPWRGLSRSGKQLHIHSLTVQLSNKNHSRSSPG